VSKVEELYTRGAQAWPAFRVSRERFIAAAGDRDVVAEDLYLALACADGNEAAIAAFRDAHVPALRQALGKLGGMSAATIDEVVQRVLVIVFVGEAGPPQITTYSGRGTLRSWIRTIGVRTGRRQLGLEADVAGDDALPDITASDPELDLLRERYRDQVKHAFAAAFAELADRERNVLRQYHIDGLTIDQLATLYQVNRATTARWVAGARLAVITRTRKHLVDRYGIAAAEVDSIIRLVRSQLDVSVREIAN
jgi:RNA polymerase sigma-70 factor (ECF subfamily)